MRKFLTGLVSLLLVSCATSRFGWESPDSGKRGKYNEDFDPLTLQEEGIEVTPIRESDSQAGQNLESVTTPLERQNTLETVQGFRVQLLSGKDSESAMEVKRRAMFLFEEPVYLDFETPYYKLRVGDCLTREEAEGLQKKAVEKGFRDPWIVPSRVFKKPIKERDD